MMEFYYSDSSPPSLAVWLTLNMLGVKYEKKEVDLAKGEQHSKKYLEINPIGKVPAIKDGNFTLSESRAIAIYLCTAYEPKVKDGKLYPSGSKEMGKINMLLNIDATAHSKIFQYADIGKLYRGQVLDEEKLTGVKESLSNFEKLLPESAFFTGDHPTLADIFILATVKLLDLTTFKEWSDYPKLLKWKETMEKLPQYEESMGKHIRKYARIFLNRS